MSEEGLVEEWREIPGYEKMYEVSNLGRVRSLDRVNSRGFNLKGRFISQRPTRLGYSQNSLSKGNVQKKEFTHRLVMRVFVGPRPSSSHYACHIDGNPNNNKLSNLKYGTQLENIGVDARRHGKTPKGERQGSSKLKNPDVIKILRSHENAATIATRYGIRDTQVRRIRNGQRWGHLYHLKDRHIVV